MARVGNALSHAKLRFGFERRSRVGWSMMQRHKDKLDDQTLEPPSSRLIRTIRGFDPPLKYLPVLAKRIFTREKGGLGYENSNRDWIPISRFLSPSFFEESRGGNRLDVRRDCAKKGIPTGIPLD